MIGSLFFRKPFLNNSVKKFASVTELTDYMKVLFVLISSIELDNVWVVDSSQNFNFPLQQMHFLFHFILLNGLNSVLSCILWRFFLFGISRLLPSQSHSAKVSPAEDFPKFVIEPDISARNNPLSHFS